jgi:hypothetical protein
MHSSSKQVLIFAGVLVIVFLAWVSCFMRAIQKADATNSVQVAA